MSKGSFKLFSFIFWMGFVASGRAASLGDTPISFFTNLAEHFLESQGGLSLTHIQLSPSNQYVPSVHRLLQVAANLYDSTTNTFLPGSEIGFPSVFRPLVKRIGPNIFICGYTNDHVATSARNWFLDNPAGIPMVLGAKKGLP